MKKQLLVLSALVAGLQIAVAQASPFPADAEQSYDLPAIESYTERMARNGDTSGSEVWGVSPRRSAPHDPFPFSVSEVD